MKTETTGRIWAEHPDGGRRRDLTFDEHRGFWTWAMVEVLRHTGIRIEELGKLFPGAGAGGGDTERSWGGGQGVGCAEHGRPNRPDGGGDAAGGHAGADLPSGQLWLSAGAQCP